MPSADTAKESSSWAHTVVGISQCSDSDIACERFASLYSCARPGLFHLKRPWRSVCVLQQLAALVRNSVCSSVTSNNT